MKKAQPKLRLTKETVRSLEEIQLARGGDSWICDMDACIGAITLQTQGNVVQPWTSISAIGVFIHCGD